MYTCEFRINANLLKEGSFRINAKLVKEELKREWILTDFKNYTTYIKIYQIEHVEAQN